MEDTLIQIGVTLVLNAIKSPGKKASIKKAMKKIYTAILAAYPEFAA